MFSYFLRRGGTSVQGGGRRGFSVLGRQKSVSESLVVLKCSFNNKLHQNVALNQFIEKKSAHAFAKQK